MKHEFNSKDPVSRRAFVENCARAAFGLSVVPLLKGTEALAAPLLAATPATAPTPRKGQQAPGFGRA
jgi:hypothetical protein